MFVSIVIKASKKSFERNSDIKINTLLAIKNHKHKGKIKDDVIEL